MYLDAALIGTGSYPTTKLNQKHFILNLNKAFMNMKILPPGRRNMVCF